MAQQNKNEQQVDVNQLLKVRREKLADLQERGKDPFQITKYDVTNHTAEIKDNFEKFECEHDEEGKLVKDPAKLVSIAGRIMLKRVMGKASFCNVQDKTGNIQVYVARNELGDEPFEEYKDFKKMDIGDIVGVKGYPFVTKTNEEITKRCVAICDELISHDVKAIVIACNTATSACVKLLREKYDVDIIGMEPALKVACDRGEHQRIAVWATQLTLSEKKFANLMNRFKDEHHIIKVPCPELVRMVEDNKLDDACLVESCLKEYLAASDYKNLDSIVLGCTHFPFYTKYLEKLCPNVHIIEGSVGTTLHTKDLLEQKGLLNTRCEEGQITWMNTMDSKIELSKCLFKKLEVEL